MNKINKTVSVEVPCLAKPLKNALKPKKFRIFSPGPNWAVVIVNSCKSEDEIVNQKFDLNLL
ncbi:MAG: hypothetical protein CL915_09250 [Deltaproteobacteria bacterium]|nr:hypothetical protein [Deltaproteobacteria bacterium]